MKKSWNLTDLSSIIYDWSHSGRAIHCRDKCHLSVFCYLSLTRYSSHQLHRISNERFCKVLHRRCLSRWSFNTPACSIVQVLWHSQLKLTTAAASTIRTTWIKASYLLLSALISGALIFRMDSISVVTSTFATLQSANKASKEVADYVGVLAKNHLKALPL